MGNIIHFKAQEYTVKEVLKAIKCCEKQGVDFGEIEFVWNFRSRGLFRYYSLAKMKQMLSKNIIEAVSWQGYVIRRTQRDDLWITTPSGDLWSCIGFKY
jgi:hypothetical protein